MKKLSVLFALLAVAMFAKGQTPTISAEECVVTADGVTTQNALILNLSESMSTFCAYEFEVYSSDGFRVMGVGSSDAWRVNETAYDEEEEVDVVVANHTSQRSALVSGANNAYRYLIMDGSIHNAPFKETNQIIRLNLRAEVGFTEGTLTFKKFHFSSYTDPTRDFTIDEFVVEVKAASAETEIVYKTNGTYGTLILPFDAELPANYKAYTVSEIDGKDLVLEEATSIVAFTPYVMEGDDSEVTFTGTPGTADKDLTFGLLTGVVAEGGLTGFHGVDGSDVYICQKQGKEVSSFYKINPEKGYTIPQYRCYLTAPKSGANMYRIGGTTGIDEVTVEEAGDVYDMLGRKVIGPLEKGVYIKNNRKIFVK